MAAMDRYSHKSNNKGGSGDSSMSKEKDASKAASTAGERGSDKSVGNGRGGAKADPMSTRHSKERSDMHDRHLKERDQMHKRHEQEHSQVNDKQAAEMEAAQAAGGVPPAAGGPAPAPATPPPAAAGAAAANAPGGAMQ